MEDCMEGQISIFDLLSEGGEKVEYDLETMTTESMAKVVGDAIGIEFKPSGWSDEYEGKYKKAKLSIHKSHYSCAVGDRKEGDPFVGCGWSLGTGGSGSPVDSIEGAIKWFKSRMERYGHDT